MGFYNPGHREHLRRIMRLTKEDLLKYNYCQRLIANGHSEGVAVASTRSELKDNPALT